MSRKHPWMAMRQALMDYRRELLAAGQPDHRQDDGDAVDAQHDEGRLLDGLGDIESDFGEPQGSNDGHEQDKADRQDHRE